MRRKGQIACRGSDPASLLGCLSVDTNCKYSVMEQHTENNPLTNGLDRRIMHLYLIQLQICYTANKAKTVKEYVREKWIQSFRLPFMC